MTKPPPADFTRTRAAIAAYDAGWERRAMLPTAAHQAAEADALRAVREAFAADTADRNTRDQAMQAQLSWIREWATQPAPTPPKATRGASAILLSSTDPTGAYMPPALTEITGDTADALGVAGLEVECFMPYPSFAEMEVWGGDYAPCDPTSTATTEDCEPPPQGAAPVAYRVTRAWYDDAGPDMGSVELAAWVAAWERDLASVIHDHLLDRACSAAEQRAEMMAG